MLVRGDLSPTFTLLLCFSPLPRVFDFPGYTPPISSMVSLLWSPSYFPSVPPTHPPSSLPIPSLPTPLSPILSGFLDGENVGREPGLHWDKGTSGILQPRADLGKTCTFTQIWQNAQRHRGWGHFLPPNPKASRSILEVAGKDGLGKPRSLGIPESPRLRPVCCRTEGIGELSGPSQTP